MSQSSLSPTDLVTERLRLRALRRADAGLLELYCGDPRVARMTTSIPHPYPPGAAAGFIARSTALEAREWTWVLDTGADDENGLVGVIALKPRQASAGELGYWVAPAFWNTGYATEAVGAVVAHAARLGFADLRAQVFQDNQASIKVLTRTGFDYDGPGEIYSVARGAMVPTFRYRQRVGGV